MPTSPADDDAIPLYLGIPLAILLCVLVVFLVTFIVYIWRSSRDDG